jgi:hypothetical protein
MSDDGMPERMRAEFREAEVVSILFRAVGPRIETLPDGDLKRDLRALLMKHGSVRGLGLSRPPRGTLLDAKIELERRVEELGIRPWQTNLPARTYQRLAEGISLTQEQIRVVSGATIGRHIHMDVPCTVKMAGQFAWGTMVGALAESWRY